MFPSTDQILQQYPETPTDERLKPHIEVAPNCPRCASTNTKFCYYNNYSLSQPRYFCKGCRRYWTKGGSLRNIPVGGGCRKSRNRARPARISSGSISRCGGPDAPFLNSSSDSDCSRRSTDHVEIDLAAVFAKFLNPNSSSDHNNHTTCPSDNKFINSESSAHTVAIYSESSLQQEPLDHVDNTQASLLDEFPDMIIYGHQQQQGTFEGMVDYDLSASCFDKGVLWSDSLDDATLSNFSWQPMVMDGGSIEHVGSFGSM